MKLKIVSFNIRGRDDPNGHSLAERVPRLYSIINGRSPDVIGLQEYRPTWDVHFKDTFLRDYDMYNLYRETTGVLESAPILWKKECFECVKKGSFWLSDTPEKESKGWDEKYDVCRICSYVILKEKRTGKQLCFMNTHFGFGDSCQIKSAKLICEYSKKISDLPTFCTGDFNMRSDSFGYAEIVKKFSDLNKLTSNESGTTFHGYAPEKHKDQHIDFIFIDDSITPVSFEILRDTFDGKYPSDHYGICGQITIE